MQVGSPVFGLFGEHSPVFQFLLIPFFGRSRVDRDDEPSQMSSQLTGSQPGCPVQGGLGHLPGQFFGQR